MIRIYDIKQYQIKAFKVNLYKCKYISEELFCYSDGITRVLYFDPINARRAIYEMAVYFCREFGYDLVQYSMQTEVKYNDKNTAAFLFHHYDVSERRIAYGACCFRYRDRWTNLYPHWALQWIWLHPLCRGKGELSRHWNKFEEFFGNFMIEEPLSKAMEYFLKNKSMKYKHNYNELLIEDNETKENNTI